MPDQKEGDPLATNEEEPTNVSYVFPNGDRYEGECCRSLSGALVRNGTGKHTSAYGVTYTGDWCNDKMQGRGTLQHPSGAAYEGEFKDNMYHGAGTYTFPDASVYKGHFQMNRLEGDGTFVDSQGAVWKGEFHGTAALGLKMEHSL
ncbi:MORN repeat-containing protein 2 [Salarias fasciatus]|uniref:MORN repeat-containing protein 2 n=1 Tax=Salarias fasciatus TaxID=181472 RepID=UPI001176B8E7|nr:MORN repeat-containing protein 2 [Salarias fasciatus]